MQVRTLWELVKTEEIYIKVLMFLERNYIEPLATGTRGAPKLTPEDLDSIFSVIKDVDVTEPHGDNDEEQNFESMEERHRSVRKMANITDLLTLHRDYVWPALLEEERRPAPSLAAFFNRVVADELLVHHLSMAVPIAANESNALKKLDSLTTESPHFAAFMVRLFMLLADSRLPAK